jgi:hypothetical protein
MRYAPDKLLDAARPQPRNGKLYDPFFKRAYENEFEFLTDFLTFVLFRLWIFNIAFIHNFSYSLIQYT